MADDDIVIVDTPEGGVIVRFHRKPEPALVDGRGLLDPVAAAEEYRAQARLYMMENVRPSMEISWSGSADFTDWSITDRHTLVISDALAAPDLPSITRDIARGT